MTEVVHLGGGGGGGGEGEREVVNRKDVQLS